MAHIDLLGEVASYGREVLGMSDREMAAELGYTWQRIQQARVRSGCMVRRCKAGHKLPRGVFVYCAKCDPDPLAEANSRILCLRPGCKYMSRGGECSRCRANRRYRDNPKFREKHDVRTASWQARNRKKAREINAEARARYEIRKAAGWTMYDPLKD